MIKLFAKIKTELTKEDIEKIEEEVRKSNHLIDTSLLVLTVISAILTGVAYYAGNYADFFASLTIASALITCFSYYLSKKEEKAIEELKRIAEEKGKVEVEVEANISDLKVIDS